MIFLSYKDYIKQSIKNNEEDAYIGESIKNDWDRDTDKEIIKPEYNDNNKDYNISLTDNIPAID